MSKPAIAATLCLAASALGAGAWTWAFAAPPASLPAAPPSAPSAYRPVTSDFMNSAVQPRHVKLWLAGQTGNWNYAEYERHNIGGALARIATAIPDYKGQSTAAMVSAFATPQLARLQSAIAAKDPSAFAAAYDGLTSGCNSCHQASGHGMLVMRRPASDPFPDQVFTGPAP